MKIVGIGPVLIDALFFLDRYPEEDTTIRANELREQVGGPVPNRLMFHAAMGDEAGFMGTVGDDSVGETIRTVLNKHGVDTQFLQVQAGQSGYAAGWLAANRKSRTVAYTTGSLNPLSDEAPVEELLENAAMLHTDGREPAAALKASAIARAKGIVVSHDAGTPKPESEQLVRAADIVQAPMLFAKQALGLTDMQDAAEHLRSLGPRIAVVTDGTHGCAYSSKGDSGVVPSFEVESTITIGAGDRFGGALSHALLHDMPVRDAVTFASAAAALRTMSVDNEIPSEEEIWQFARSTPTRSDN